MIIGEGGARAPIFHIDIKSKYILWNNQLRDENKLERLFLYTVCLFSVAEKLKLYFFFLCATYCSAFILLATDYSA